MKNRIVCWEYLMMLVCMMGLVGCGNQGSDALRVVPGEGVGEVLLGALHTDVMEKLGQPLQSEQVADSLSRDEWKVGGVILTALFHQGKVIQIQVNGPAYSTPSGLSGQSTVSDIRAAYPDMDVSIMAHDMENMYLDDVDQGIAFSVRGAREGEPANKDGDVINVFIHPPGEEVIAVVHHHEGH